MLYPKDKNNEKFLDKCKKKNNIFRIQIQELWNKIMINMI
jgi:hypothetical protein